MVNNEERWKEGGNEWIRSRVGDGGGGVYGVDGDSDGGSRSRRNLKPILWFDELRRSALLLKLSSTCDRMQEVPKWEKKTKNVGNVPSFSALPLKHKVKGNSAAALFLAKPLAAILFTQNAILWRPLTTRGVCIGKRIQWAESLRFSRQSAFKSLACGKSIGCEIGGSASN